MAKLGGQLEMELDSAVPDHIFRVVLILESAGGVESASEPFSPPVSAGAPWRAA